MPSSVEKALFFDTPKSIVHFHRLIYTHDNSGVLQPVASGVLLKVGCKFFLITAAHVLDENKTEDDNFVNLVTYGKQQAVVLFGKSHRTVPPSGKTRQNDRIDIGFIELSSDLVQQIGEEHFWPSEMADVDDNGQSGNYCAIGYPASLNIVIDPEKTTPTNPTPASYTAVLRTVAEHRKAGVKIDTHLLLKLSNKNTKNTDGNRVEIPDMHGMSGGGFWKFEKRDLKFDPKLVGVTIEYHSGNIHGLLAARIFFIYEAIRHIYTELSQYLPKQLAIQQAALT